MPTPPSWPPPGTWVAASHALGREVPAAEPYPHICGITVPGLMTYVTFRLGRKECAACAEQRTGRSA